MTTLDPGEPPRASGEPDLAEGVEERFASLPWWQRPRRLRRQVATALVVTALLAVATFGGLNYVAARQLLVTGTEQHLAGVGAMRADIIEAGANRLVAEISAASSDLAIARGLEEFTSAFDALDQEMLTAQERAELEAWYEERVVTPINEAGLGPYDLDDVVPVRPAAQWVQYHYTVRPIGVPPPDDAGDGTAYSELNAQLGDSFRTFSDSKGFGDVLLIDDTGTVVYTLDKLNDVGTDLVNGPYSSTALAQLVTEPLPAAPVGTTLLTDFAISATGRPALYAVSSVTNGTKVVGALAVQVPVEAFNSIISADGDWESIGIADGDSYIVAADRLLQSEPRAWLEDPETYLDRLRSGDEADQAEADLVELFGSPVGVQEIDTAPVRAATDGEEFRGRSSDYFGDATYAASEPFTAGGRQWIVVTEVPRSTAVEPLNEYVLEILLVLAFVLPIVAGLGIWVSRLFTRPIRPTVETAEAIVEGDRDPDVDTSRPDEFGDLGRRLSLMADSLAAHETELADEYERTRQLLLAVLPPHLVDEDGKITGTGDAAARATVVAVTLEPSDQHQGHEAVGEALWRAAELAEKVADEANLQRVRVAADRYLFLAGLGQDDAGADAAVEFADEFRRQLSSDDSDVSLALHVGLSSGAVATGVLDSGLLTFGAWGDPVRRALAIASLSDVDVVLIDAATAEGCTPGRWRLEQANDVVDLDGEAMDLYTLDVDDRVAPAPR